MSALRLGFQGWGRICECTEDEGLIWDFRPNGREDNISSSIQANDVLCGLRLGHRWWCRIGECTADRTLVVV